MLAPTLQTRTLDGESRLRVSEGLEFGLREGEPMQLSVAGQGVSRLAVQGRDGEDDDGGVPGWTWVAGGIVVVTAGGLLVLVDSVNDSSD